MYGLITILRLLTQPLKKRLIAWSFFSKYGLCRYADRKKVGKISKPEVYTFFIGTTIFKGLGMPIKWI